MPSFLLDLLRFCLNLTPNMYIIFTSDNPMQKFKLSRYNFRTSTIIFHNVVCKIVNMHKNHRHILTRFCIFGWEKVEI